MQFTTVLIAALTAAVSVVHAIPSGATTKDLYCVGSVVPKPPTDCAGGTAPYDWSQGYSPALWQCCHID